MKKSKPKPTKPYTHLGDRNKGTGWRVTSLIFSRKKLVK